MSQPNTKKRTMNISSLTITRTSPSSATAVTIDGLKSLKVDPGISNIQDAGNADQGPTYNANDYQDISLDFGYTDAFSGLGLSPQSFYTIVATINDADQGSTASGGGHLATFTNCYLDGNPLDHGYRKYSTAETKFGTIWADGVTSPQTITAL